MRASVMRASLRPSVPVVQRMRSLTCPGDLWRAAEHAVADSPPPGAPASPASPGVSGHPPRPMSRSRSLSEGDEKPTAVPLRRPLTVCTALRHHADSNYGSHGLGMPGTNLLRNLPQGLVCLSACCGACGAYRTQSISRRAVAPSRGDVGTCQTNEGAPSRRIKIFGRKRTTHREWPSAWLGVVLAHGLVCVARRVEHQGSGGKIFDVLQESHAFS
jgi:hypothetical protein